jgi:NAD-dependent SIR2 family protein deacetylase
MSPCESFPFQDVYCTLELGHLEPHHYRSTHDHDFHKVAGSMQYHIEHGAMVYQKFTCQHCGNRLAFDVPDKMYTKGECDRCGGVTDIMENGSNFLLVYKNPNARKRKGWNREGA